MPLMFNLTETVGIQTQFYNSELKPVTLKFRLSKHTEGARVKNIKGMRPLPDFTSLAAILNEDIYLLISENDIALRKVTHIFKTNKMCNVDSGGIFFSNNLKIQDYMH